MLSQAHVSKVIYSQPWHHKNRHVGDEKIPGGRDLVTTIEAVLAAGAKCRP